MVGYVARFRDVTGQSYPIYACTFSFPCNKNFFLNVSQLKNTIYTLSLSHKNIYIGQLARLEENKNIYLALERSVRDISVVVYVRGLICAR